MLFGDHMGQRTVQQMPAWTDEVIDLRLPPPALDALTLQKSLGT